VRGTALVIGAGIGGLAAAIALHRAGWLVRVLERAATPRELGFALLLAPNAVWALRQLGVADAVIAAGHVATSGEMRRADGRLLRRFELERVRELLPEATVTLAGNVTASCPSIISAARSHSASASDTR
jgi:2-polyprenyl-6-methoxyphenol hydroxylase-like FAD-dependent oxidoreductase